MKRHHVVAVLLLIFGGYFAYTRFHHGDIDGVGAIWMGIAFPLFGAIAFFDGRLLPRLRIFVKAMMLLIAWGLLTYSDFINGNIRSAMILSIVLILAGVPMLFEDKPSAKKTMRPSLRHIRYTGIVASLVLITVLLLLAFVRSKPI